MVVVTRVGFRAIHAPSRVAARWAVMAVTVAALTALSPGQGRADPPPVADVQPAVASGQLVRDAAVEAIPAISPAVPVTARAAARRVPRTGDPLRPITSPDRGDWCAAGLDAASLTRFWSQQLGDDSGGDYHHALRLPDGRVLWTVQDAIIAGRLVHNAGFIQSGRCFTLLNDGTRPWLMADETDPEHHWFWILSGSPAADGTIQLFVAEMTELGDHYLAHAEPQATWLVTVDATSLQQIEAELAPDSSTDLYGFSVVSDTRYTYLYSHCHRQFGWSAMGPDPCAEYVRLARVPLRHLEAVPQYWMGLGWTDDPLAAVPVVTAAVTASRVNPVQVTFDGWQFQMIVKNDDWWGHTIELFSARTAAGPWKLEALVPEPVKCATHVCNTYFAAWLPWRDPSDALIWSLDHNHWDGVPSADYRPTFQTAPL